MFDKLLDISILFYVFDFVEDWVVENWFHDNVLSFLSNFLNNLMFLEIDQINVQIFCLYANPRKLIIEIVKTEIQDFLAI